MKAKSIIIKDSNYYLLNAKNTYQLLANLQKDYFFGEISQYEALLTLDTVKQLIIDQYAKRWYAEAKAKHETELDYESWFQISIKTPAIIGKYDNLHNILFFINQNYQNLSKEEFKKLRIAHFEIEKLNERIHQVVIPLQKEIQEGKYQLGINLLKQKDSRFDIFLSSFSEKEREEFFERVHKDLEKKDNQPKVQEKTKEKEIEREK